MRRPEHQNLLSRLQNTQSNSAQDSKDTARLVFNSWNTASIQDRIRTATTPDSIHFMQYLSQAPDIQLCDQTSSNYQEAILRHGTEPAISALFRHYTINNDRSKQLHKIMLRNNCRLLRSALKNQHQGAIIVLLQYYGDLLKDQKPKLPTKRWGQLMQDMAEQVNHQQIDSQKRQNEDRTTDVIAQPTEFCLKSDPSGRQLLHALQKGGKNSLAVRLAETGRSEAAVRIVQQCGQYTDCNYSAEIFAHLKSAFEQTNQTIRSENNSEWQRLERRQETLNSILRQCSALANTQGDGIPDSINTLNENIRKLGQPLYHSEHQALVKALTTKIRSRNTTILMEAMGSLSSPQIAASTNNQSAELKMAHQDAILTLLDSLELEARKAIFKKNPNLLRYAIDIGYKNVAELMAMQQKALPAQLNNEFRDRLWFRKNILSYALDSNNAAAIGPCLRHFLLFQNDERQIARVMKGLSHDQRQQLSEAAKVMRNNLSEAGVSQQNGEPHQQSKSLREHLDNLIERLDKFGTNNQGRRNKDEGIRLEDLDQEGAGKNAMIW